VGVADGGDDRVPGRTGAQLTAALVDLVTALVTTLAATPLRYVVDRALLVQRSKTELYEFEANACHAPRASVAGS
jgi:hypothetical protein